MIRICTELVPTYTTRDGRACGYHRAWVEQYDVDGGRYVCGPAFDGQTRAEAVGNCILGTPALAADPSGMLTVIDRTPPALREHRDQATMTADAAAIAAHVYRAKGGHRAHS